ncbi:MAG: ABC transporter ATP-binding protein [Actinomyces sp.]|nr:MAG: ABC transporter ATP-binding protein [Actinomyces sp.]
MTAGSPAPATRLDPVVEFDGVSVELGGREVLRRVDLVVGRGEWVDVIGPNGAGKTTLLRAVLGAVAHTGRLTLSRLGARPSPRERARTVAYVPQSPVIPPGVAVVDYVLLGRTPHHGPFGADSPRDLAVVAEVLERLDLARLAERELRSLSGGERQRAVLARALAQEADLLLLDEPTTALDLGHQQEVLELVHELRREQGLTVLATLHDLTLAARYGDRLALLADGRIVADGPAVEVLTADHLETHFGARVRVLDDPDGPVVVPVPHTPLRPAPVRED